MMNRQVEVDARSKKPPSEIETLAEERGMLIRGTFLQNNTDNQLITQI